MDTLNDCVQSSFAEEGDYSSENLILGADRIWSIENHVTLHPSILINNMTFTNSTGQSIAMAICEAYREAPDECDLRWKINVLQNGELTSFEDEMLPGDEDKMVSMARN